jgi:hypothetical protein
VSIEAILPPKQDSFIPALSAPGASLITNLPSFPPVFLGFSPCLRGEDWFGFPIPRDSGDVGDLHLVAFAWPI